VEVSGQLQLQPLCLREMSLSTHWLGGWAGLRAGLDAVEKRKVSCSRWEWNPGTSACSPSLYRLSYPCSHCVCVCVRARACACACACACVCVCRSITTVVKPRFVLSRVNSLIYFKNIMMIIPLMILLIRFFRTYCGYRSTKQ
jgi:hypothetical protein